ncbi:unnamed protein product, partial [Brenthis ino]
MSMATFHFSMCTSDFIYNQLFQKIYQQANKMSRLDLVIFGATGFTGKHAVQEQCRISKEYPGMTWGVAGRNQSKLEEMLKEISKKTDEDLSSVKIIIADVQDEKSLKEMCSQAKVLVNCCGPYRHYGEPVVKAAIDSKTHYVDVSGEPQFMETMQLVYDQAARDAGVYVVSACGFDSIPNDMGVIYLQQNFGGTLNSVESYVSTRAPLEERRGLANLGTWESLVYGIANYNELPALRKKLYPERLPTFKPKLKPRGVIHARDAGWCVPFPGADASVVYRTQRALYEREHRRPAQCRAYVRLPALLHAVALVAVAALLYVLARLRPTRALLLKYPGLFTMGIFTKEPSEAAINATTFQFDLFGEGWEAGTDVEAVPPNKKMTVRVSGSNPGYGATVVALLYSAIMLLKESDKIPTYGVLTPGLAFRGTGLLRRLAAAGLRFEVLPAHE